MVLCTIYNKVKTMYINQLNKCNTFTFYKSETYKILIINELGANRKNGEGAPHGGNATYIVDLIF